MYLTCGDQDALLAIATGERAYAFQVPSDIMAYLPLTKSEVMVA